MILFGLYWRKQARQFHLLSGKNINGRDLDKAYLSKPEKSTDDLPGHSPLLQIQVPRRQMLGNIS